MSGCSCSSSSLNVLSPAQLLDHRSAGAKAFANAFKEHKLSEADIELGVISAGGSLMFYNLLKLGNSNAILHFRYAIGDCTITVDYDTKARTYTIHVVIVKHATNPPEVIFEASWKVHLPGEGSLNAMNVVSNIEIKKSDEHYHPLTPTTDCIRRHAPQCLGVCAGGGGWICAGCLGAIAGCCLINPHC
jgi:hypothetical protein